MSSFPPVGTVYRCSMCLSEVTSVPKQEESWLSLDSTSIFVREDCSQPSVNLGSTSEGSTNSG